MSLRFHLVVSEVDPGNEYFMCERVGAKMRYEKILLRYSTICKKEMCLGSGLCVCVCVCEQVEFLVSGKTFFDFVI